ncbi:MAG: efflux RND transporter periplasmic adaptor subunit [Rhizobiales bacterium]|nr:efflux RND transporter periplasmic adaptor subunit [Hyphomicrobiales bacterium]
MIRRTIYFLLVTLVLGGLAAGIGYWSFIGLPGMIETAIKSSPQPVQTVSAEEAKTESWQPEITAIGTLTASEGIDIAPQAGGVVTEVLFESGTAVKKGDKLVQLDTATDEAELKNFKAQLANAEREIARTQKLSSRGFAPKADLDNLRSTRDQVLAQIERIEALIAQKSVFAPWDGKLGLRSISVGSYVAPGQKVVWLQKVEPIYVDFSVAEEDYGRISDGQKVTARFTAWPDQVFSGTVTTTDARMSEASRMITVRAAFDNPDGKLVPGMYANVAVESGEPQNVVTVPQTAVTYTLYGDNVFVVVPAKQPDPNNKDEQLEIERRFVKAGGMRNGRVQIADGLKPGDRVVTAGHNKIDQGSKVRIDNTVALRQSESATIQ